MADKDQVQAWVDQVMDGYTEKQLRYAFDCVCDLDNWKNPIDVVVGASVSTPKAQFEAAIIFYTGSVPVFTDNDDGSYRVQAEGYYAAIGA